MDTALETWGILAYVSLPPDSERDEIVLSLPSGLIPPRDLLAGRYFLARCADASPLERMEWSIYPRQPLRVTGLSRRPDADYWQLEFQDSPPSVRRWFVERSETCSIHLLGPLGNTFRPFAQSRNFLLYTHAQPHHIWIRQLLPICDSLLDLGGRVTLLMDRAEALPEGLRRRLPLSVEVFAEDESQAGGENLSELVRWSDQIFASVPRMAYTRLAQTAAAARFRIEPDFVQVLTRPQFLCGYGACLGCVVETAGGGFTRGCIHGPVFDLKRLVEL